MKVPYGYWSSSLFDAALNATALKYGPPLQYQEASKMVFIVNDEIQEQDYAALLNIQYLAFSDEPAILALYPGGLDAVAFDQNVLRFKEGLRLKDPQVVIGKAMDKETGQICGFLVARLFEFNPFCGTESSDIHLPDLDSKDGPWVEWLFNRKNNRKKEIKDLQASSSYACKYLREDVAVVSLTSLQTSWLSELTLHANARERRLFC